MRLRFSRYILMIFFIASFNIPTVNAALNAPISLENPRVVPIFGIFEPKQVPTTAGWSGFLYSSRIVLSAAHANYSFDGNGNRQLKELSSIVVGMPNSSARDISNRVKVIKTFVGNYRLSQSGYGLDDFVVYVLEKDLITVQPASLWTTDIQKELVAAKVEVQFHGYGEYRDRCGPSEVNPCKKDFNNPNHSTSEFPRVSALDIASASDFPSISGQMLIDLGEEILISNPKGCPGDSGGPITTIYKNRPLYLGQGLNAGGVYACGAGGAKSKDNDQEAFGYFSPVYKHLDLIAQAEEFVKGELEAEAKAAAEKAAAEKAAAARVAAELKEKQEAEAKAAAEKAAAELKAKQEAEAKAAAEKAAAELKAKQEEDARIKAETEAKAAAQASSIKKTVTISCKKGNTTRKVTAVNPKCPKGFKKR